MNMKSLLIGSAAALVAVSGARAADAVVIAEPEPFEYVRVCDTYGVGFYYIPGTETCLRISGLIRYDINFSEDNIYYATHEDGEAYHDYFDEDRFDELDPEAFFYLEDKFDNIHDDHAFGDGFLSLGGGLDEGWAKQAIARINIDARSETEFGTFRRFIRLEGATAGDYDDNKWGGIYGLADTAAVNVIYAYMELGGLLVGLYDSLYDGTMSVENDNGGGTSAHQIRYTFSGGNGLTFQVSLEEQDYNYDYMPNVYGRVAIAQGWGGVAVFAGYDATFESFGVKGLASFNVSDAILLEAMATYESDFGDFSVTSGNGLKGYEFSLAAAASFRATDRIKLAVFGQYFGDQHVYHHDSFNVRNRKRHV